MEKLGKRMGRKLNPRMVREIRSMRGKMQVKELAFRFGVTSSTITRIMRNTRHVDVFKEKVCVKCGQEMPGEKRMDRGELKARFAEIKDLPQKEYDEAIFKILVDFLGTVEDQFKHIQEKLEEILEEVE